MNDAALTRTPFSACAIGPEGFSAEIYEELRKIAHTRMSERASGNTLQATVLVHEAWLRLSRRESPWENERHFLAGAVTTMRYILIDHARRKARLRHGGGLLRAATVMISELAAPCGDERLLIIDEAVKALEIAKPLEAQIVIARFYGGLSNREIAQMLEVSERGVERHWASAKVWLFRWIKNAGTR